MCKETISIRRLKQRVDLQRGKIDKTRSNVGVVTRSSVKAKS